jgi:alpha-1,2-mannosyltransferase
MMLRLLAIGSFLAVMGIIVAALVMGNKLLARRGRKLHWPEMLAVTLAVLFCYPLLKGFGLGNAQTYLSFGFAVLILLWTLGHERSSGVLACAMTCVKPQFALILIWMLIRKRWNAAIAFLVTGLVLFAISVAVFGLHNNLDFLKVLSSLSHKAQSHYGNQSMFGTVNRMIFNGENLGYTPYVYTPYIPWVYRLTVATAIILLALALFFPWGKLKGSTADLSAIGLVSVASSPMAWEHHYGIVLAIFAWLWFSYGEFQSARPWLTGLAFFLTCNELSGFNFLWHYRGWNLLQSYIYLGALLLLGILMTLARRVTRGVEPALL